MNVSLNWLKEFLPIHQTSTDLAETLTNLGLAVDGHFDHESIPGGLAGVVVGKVKECVKHPNADRLSLTKVDIGTGTLLSIVCGAPNVAAGQTVLVATIGSILHTSTGEKLEIKKGKIRGEVSEGMICAGDELSLSDDHSGIIVLEDHWIAGTHADEIYPIYRDTVFEVDLTPNRSDATSHLGVARDLGAYYKSKQLSTIDPISIPETTISISTNDHKVSVIIEDISACPRYSGISISGVTITGSPSWLKDRLLAIGVRPINIVVDITNYILHAYGQPLHAFDLDKINGSATDQISLRIKKLPSGTKFVTLDGVERNLHPDDLIICNGDSDPMCIAGVFGGLHSGISDTTKNIFLESAHFSASGIRRTSMRHGLRTDAATRFEKGTDPNSTILALKVAAKMIVDLAGGQISSEPVDVYPVPIAPVELAISLDNVRKVIGQNIPDEHLIHILHALDMQPVKPGSLVHIKVPTSKADVRREIDVIEEILRIHGYNEVPMPSKMEVSFANSSEAGHKQQVKEETASFLCHIGFCEMMGLSLMDSRILKTSGYQEDHQVYINNTSNVHLDILRPDVLRSGLSTLQYNQNRQQTDLKLFEFGKTYKNAPASEWPFDEHDYLSIFTSGKVKGEHWQTKEVQHGYFYVKSLVYQLLEKWGLSNFADLPSEHPDFDQSQQIIIHKEVLIRYGTIQDTLAKSFDLRNEVYYIQIDWEQLWKLLKAKKAAKIVVPGKYPSVRRDLAVVVDKAVSWDQIKQVLNAQNTPNLQYFNLFDVFEDEERVGKDKKSLAISLIFESPSQTLKDEDLEKSMRRLQDQLQNKIGAVMR